VRPLVQAGSEQLAGFYREAKRYVLEAGFADEVAWQESRLLRNFDETDLLREAAWVILCTGFRESVVKRKFNYISLCFCDWSSAQEILAFETECRETAVREFRNKRKIDAIVSLARYIATSGFEFIRSEALKSPLNCFSDLPYIGPITANHLAKNLGFDLSKSDRHMMRIARELGYDEPSSLCAELSRMTGDRIAVVDIVLWRFMAISDRTAPPSSFRRRDTQARRRYDPRTFDAGLSAADTRCNSGVVFEAHRSK